MPKVVVGDGAIKDLPSLLSEQKVRCVFLFADNSIFHFILLPFYFSFLVLFASFEASF